MDAYQPTIDASMEPKPLATSHFSSYRGACRMDRQTQTTPLRSVEQLLEAYPTGAPEVAAPGIAYAGLGQEAACTVALGRNKTVRDRCIACGLRPDVWGELANAHRDFVSTQAHFEAANAHTKPDEASKQRVAELTSLRREFAAQTTFYVTSPDDAGRLAPKSGNLMADVRALVQVIRPHRARILDPAFKTEWLDHALALAEAEEKVRATREASAAAKPARDNSRQRLASQIHNVEPNGTKSCQPAPPTGTQGCRNASGVGPPNRLTPELNGCPTTGHRRSSDSFNPRSTRSTDLRDTLDTISVRYSLSTVRT